MENSGFNQICIWAGITLNQNDNFEKKMKDVFEVNTKFIMEAKTITSKRNDILFFIHDNDVFNFDEIKLEYNIYWWEDSFNMNCTNYLYSKELLNKLRSIISKF